MLPGRRDMSSDNTIADIELNQLAVANLMSIMNHNKALKNSLLSGKIKCNYHILMCNFYPNTKIT